MSDAFPLKRFSTSHTNFTCVKSFGQILLRKACCLSMEVNHDFAKMGIVMAGKANIDVNKLQAQKNKAVKGLTGGIEMLFKKNGVVYKKGTAKLTSAQALEVTPERGAVEKINAKHIILATGSEPSPLPGGGVKADEKVVLTSTGALTLKSVPKKMLVVGGGVIGLELGSVWNRLGAHVEVVEFMDSIAPLLDGDMRRLLQKALEKQGMKFHLSSKVTSADIRPNDATVHFQNKKGTHMIDCDAVLLAVGRRPYTAGLGLEQLGILTDKIGRVVVDSNYRVPSAPSIYAIGDIIQGPMLAHKAEDEGLAVASFLGGEVSAPHVNYDAIPTVVYTHPEIGGVGKTEEQLKESGVDYVKSAFPFMANSRARTNDEAEGMVKILANPSGALLGGWIFGTNAGELVAELGVALECGITVQQIARTCHAHPTLSEAVREACMAASPGGRAIHNV